MLVEPGSTADGLHALGKVTSPAASLCPSQKKNNSPELVALWQGLHKATCVEHVRCSAILSCYFIVFCDWVIGLLLNRMKAKNSLEKYAYVYTQDSEYSFRGGLGG